MKKSISDQIKDLENTRAAKVAAMQAITEKCADEGVTKDAAQREEFDTLRADVDSVDAEIKDLKVMQQYEAENAKAVDATTSQRGTESRHHAVVKNTQKLEPGIMFARYAQALAVGRGNLHQSLEYAKGRFGDNPEIVNTLKAAVAAGTTTDTTWASPLVDYQNFAGDFVEFLRPQTIIGRAEQYLRRVPFNVRIAGQTSGGTAYWVGEGAPKPLTSFDFNAITLGHSKVAAIAVITDELARLSTPSAESLVRQSLADAVIERIDIDFIDPAKTAAAGVSPASLTNGVTPIASSGTDADAVRADLRALVGTYLAANQTLQGAFLIMSPTTALALSLMYNDLGTAQAFPNIGPAGGNLNGIPVIVSNYVVGDTAGGMVIMVNGSDVFLADDGQVVLDASREASLQMLDNPTNNSATATATSMVSMFQTNSVAIRAERWINWAKRRANAVQYLSGVNWGAGA